MYDTMRSQPCRLALSVVAHGALGTSLPAVYHATRHTLSLLDAFGAFVRSFVVVPRRLVARELMAVEVGCIWQSSSRVHSQRPHIVDLIIGHTACPRQSRWHQDTGGAVEGPLDRRYKQQQVLAAAVLVSTSQDCTKNTIHGPEHSRRQPWSPPNRAATTTTRPRGPPSNLVRRRRDCASSYALSSAQTLRRRRLGAGMTTMDLRRRQVPQPRPANGTTEAHWSGGSCPLRAPNGKPGQEWRRCARRAPGVVGDAATARGVVAAHIPLSALESSPCLTFPFRRLQCHSVWLARKRRCVRCVGPGDSRPTLWAEGHPARCAPCCFQAFRRAGWRALAGLAHRRRRYAPPPSSPSPSRCLPRPCL